jgi:hypothetical protein
VDRRALLGVDRAELVDGLTDDVEDAAEHSLPTGIMMGLPVSFTHAADEAVGGVHRDGAHHVLAEVLRDLEHEVVRLVEMARVRHPEGVVGSSGSWPRGEIDVDDGADDL